MPDNENELEPLKRNKNISIGQYTVADRIISFMKIESQQSQGAQDSQKLNSQYDAMRDGLCYGFAVVHSYMNAIDKLKWWEVALQAVSQWDGKQESLDKEIRLQDSNTPGETLRSVINRVTNYVLYNFARALESGLPGQDQTSFLKPSAGTKALRFDSEKGGIKKQSAIAGNFSDEVLKTLFADAEFFRQEAIYTICSRTHGCTLRYSNTDQAWYFYDPNNLQGEKRCNTPDDLIEEIRYSLPEALVLEIASWKDDIRTDVFTNFYNKFDNNAWFYLLKQGGFNLIAQYAPNHLPTLFALAANDWSIRVRVGSELELKSYADLPSLATVVNVLSRAHILTSENFDQVKWKKDADLASLVIVVNVLSQANILTQENFNRVMRWEPNSSLPSWAIAVNALSKANILTQKNFDQVSSHAKLYSLAPAVNALSQANILTQENFNQVRLDKDLASQVSELDEKNKLTKDSFEMLSSLNKVKILSIMSFLEVSSHADLPSLAKAVSALSQENILTQENFDQVRSHADLASRVSTLSQEGRFTKDSFEVLCALNKENILTQENFNQVKSHADLPSLAKAVNAAGILTQRSFDLAVFTSQADLYIEKIESDKNKSAVNGYVNDAIQMTESANNIEKKEIIKKLCEVGQAIMTSCLKHESGVLGMGFFSKTGKTASYQDAMTTVKKSLLKILANAELGSIPKEDVDLAKTILGEHVRRGPHIMDASSLSHPDFQKHEKHYKEQRIEKGR